MQSQNRHIQSVTYAENFCSYQQYKQSKSTLQGAVEPQQIFQNYREGDKALCQLPEGIFNLLTEG